MVAGNDRKSIFGLFLGFSQKPTARRTSGTMVYRATFDITEEERRGIYADLIQEKRENLDTYSAIHRLQFPTVEDLSSLKLKRRLTPTSRTNQVVAICLSEVIQN